MSKKNIETAEVTKQLPAYRIYSVTKGETDQDATWFECGAAWKHKDGKGYHLQFKAMPLAGTDIVLREPLPPKAG